jgi:hypothetical protein
MVDGFVLSPRIANITADPKSLTLVETSGGWHREITFPSPETVTVLWRRDNVVLTEHYWVHQPDLLKATAATAGLRWQLTRDWYPADPDSVWKERTMSPHQVLIFVKPPAC